MRRLALGVALALLVPVTLLGPADADCAGPSIRVSPTSGAGGATVVVHGQAFGNNCYDTGPPPPGEGVLGVPQAGVGITFTDAAGTTTELATVDADDDYGFSATVTVPADAVDGRGRFDAVSPSGNPGAPGVPFDVGDAVVPATPAFTG